MQSSQQEITPILGTAMDGGFYAGRIRIAGQAFAIIVAPKATGEHPDTRWSKDRKDVPSALSYNDGLTNTLAMAEAGSELAKWATGLDIGGHTDWYLPSQDELEVIYRNLKPTTDENSQYGRSGINVNAFDPTAPYSRAVPAQTQAEAFQEGGAEAFDPTWYWTSTQHASYSGCAWCQDFGSGGQDSSLDKGAELRARAVRRLPI